MRHTRKIQQWEIEAYNPTRPVDDKFTNSDYMCKKSAYDRDILNKLGKLEDIEEKYDIKSVDDLDKRLMALEAIKALIDIKIDLRDEPQQSVVTLGKQSWFIGDRKIAELFKEVFL